MKPSSRQHGWHGHVLPVAAPVRHELAAGHLVLLDIVSLSIIRLWYVTHLNAKRLSPAAGTLKHFLEGVPLIKAWVCCLQRLLSQSRSVGRTSIRPTGLPCRHSHFRRQQ